MAQRSSKSMKDPLVSVIIPVFNGERYLRQAIESVLCQEYPNMEIIAVDDGSTDSSAKILQSYPEIRYFYQENQKDAKARNHAIAQSSGEIICFIDCDDLWSKNKIRTQVDYLNEHPEIGYVFAHAKFFLEKNDPPPLKMKSSIFEKSLPAYLPSALMIRRSVFERVGPFDPNRAYSSDFDWFFRAKDLGMSMAVMPEILLYRRIHKNNVSHQLHVQIPALLKTIRDSIERKTKTVKN